ncbi:MAG: hypothetical protein ACE5HA_03075 [Anaerolineae bacterium]
MDNRSGMIYGVTLDEGGQELDPAQLETDERAAYFARYGRLDPAHVELLEDAPADEPIRVTIWLTQPPYDEPERPDPDSDLSGRV